MFIVQIEEAGKFKPLEVDLKRLEDMSDAIVQDFAATRKREEEMRSTNGKYRFNVFFFFRHLIRIKSSQLTPSIFRFPFHRVNQQPCAVLQHIQHVLLIGFGHLASALLATIFQSEETHRLSAQSKRTFHLNNWLILY